MFIGHYAVAFAAKKSAPKTSLGTLFFAAQFLDLLWPIFLLFGLEHVRIDPGNTAFTPLDFYDYPISHSLLTVSGWALAFGLVYFVLCRHAKPAVILGLCVLSHWILDLITHRPDLPLAPGAQIYGGLGLWNSVAATVLLEGALFGLAVLFYARTTNAIDRAGRYAFWGFVVFSVLLYVGNVLGRENPPPNAEALALFGLSQWLIVPWGYWIDRHRTMRA
ncbi:hypothetical protein DWB58_16685 [candidate division KSB1 bacterium]|nr:hypothetical protein [candidate division KSB1 bacterium]